MGLLTIISILISIVGLAVAYFGIQYKKRNRYSWKNIDSGIIKLSKWLRAEREKNEFIPDAFLAAPGGGVIIAELLAIEYREFIPIIMPFQSSAEEDPVKKYKDLSCRSSTKYHYYFPNLRFLKGKKVLIVDIFSSTGSTIKVFKKELIKNEVSTNNIKSVVIVETSTYRVVENSADKAAYKSDTANVYWPWGYAIRLERDKGA